MKIPRLISTIFHPLFMPLFGLILVFNASTYLDSSIPDNIQWVVIFTVFIFTCLLPLLNVLYLRRKGMVRSIYLETKKERRLPYAITIIYYIILYTFLKELQLPPILYLIILGSMLASILAFIINFKWKISAHMIGIGGLVGMILGMAERLTLDLNGILIFLFLAAGLVGFSRLKLKAHNPAQIYTGFFVGAGSLLIMLL
ncbi:MAG: hypothetical protein JKX73_06405 [Flavobacteriales bacterium]|nr:hypothetical protein [Flavobacteriales bacterium]